MLVIIQQVIIQNNNSWHYWMLINMWGSVPRPLHVQSHLNLSINNEMHTLIKWRPSVLKTLIILSRKQKLWDLNLGLSDFKTELLILALQERRPLKIMLLNIVENYTKIHKQHTKD